MRNDKELLNKAFRELRKKGYIAKQNFSCCQTCGWSEIESNYQETDKVCFYHSQSNDNSFTDKNFCKSKNIFYPLYLNWCGTGNEIKEVFEKYGFGVIWDGTSGCSIALISENSVDMLDRYVKGKLLTIRELLAAVDSYSQGDLNYNTLTTNEEEKILGDGFLKVYINLDKKNGFLIKFNNLQKIKEEGCVKSKIMVSDITIF